MSSFQQKAGWYEYDLKNDKKIEVEEVEKKTTLEDFIDDNPDTETTTKEAPDLNDMTKRELELYARGFKDAAGNIIELDRRMNKANMMKAFNEQLGD